MRIVYSPKRHDLIDGAIREVVDSQRKWPRPEALVLVPDIRTLCRRSTLFGADAGRKHAVCQGAQLQTPGGTDFFRLRGNSARILNIAEQGYITRLISELHADGNCSLWAI